MITLRNMSLFIMMGGEELVIENQTCYKGMLVRLYVNY